MTSVEDTYDGMPVVELPITDVDVPAPAQLRRSLRTPVKLISSLHGPPRQP